MKVKKMRPMQKQIIYWGLCILFGVAIGLGWWLLDGGKTCKKASDCPGGHPIENEKAIKVYRGQWVADIKQVGTWWSSRYLQREVVK